MKYKKYKRVIVILFNHENHKRLILGYTLAGGLL